MKSPTRWRTSRTSADRFEAFGARSGARGAKRRGSQRSVEIEGSRAARQAALKAGAKTANARARNLWKLRYVWALCSACLGGLSMRARHAWQLAPEASPSARLSRAQGSDFQRPFAKLQTTARGPFRLV